MHILAELTPLDPVAGTRATLRVASAQDRTITGLNAVRWWPGISQMPALSMQLFDGDFSSAVQPGGATLTLQEDVLEKANANARRMLWAGATVKLYAGVSGQAWPWTLVFQGVADSFERRANRLKISANVDISPFQANVLTATYAGTGGSAGGADLKGKVKPYLAGRTLNVEPVLIDATNSVFQFHGYGAIQAVNALYERASDYGASVGDFASYAALVAATIAPGRWGTCLAEGMVRPGAPPYGVITGDVDGDKPSGTWIRKTGAIINRACSLAGVSGGAIDSASLTALDTAVARNINIYLAEQITVLDLAQRLARPCNAQAGVSWTGKLFVCRVAIGSPAITLDAQGRRLPAVQECVERDVSPPYARMQMGAARSWRVHSFDEISTSAPLLDRGDYDNAVTYREGNIVNLADGSRYEFINATPSAGHIPPNVTYWAPLQDGPVVDFDTQVGGGTKPEDNAEVSMEITGPAESSVLADYAGTPKSGQLTKTLTLKLLRSGGATDVTAAATWGVSIARGTGTAAPNATAGKIDVSAISSSELELDISATYGGLVRHFTHKVKLDPDQVPVGGGGGGTGGTSQSDVTIGNATAATYGSANAGPLTVTAGSNGRVDLSAPLNFYRTTNGTGDAYGKWQWRTSGAGSYADVSSETHAGSTSFKNSGDGSNDAGFVAVTDAKTGLTNGAAYDFQLLLRNDASYTQTFSGTAAAVGS